MRTGRRRRAGEAELEENAAVFGNPNIVRAVIRIEALCACLTI